MGQADERAPTHGEGGHLLGESRNWTVAGSAIYRQVAGEDDVAATTWRVPLDGGASERLPWPPSTGARSFAVFSDGRGAVIARSDLTQLELAWLPPPSASGQD